MKISELFKEVDAIVSNATCDKDLVVIEHEQELVDSLVSSTSKKLKFKCVVCGKEKEIYKNRLLKGWDAGLYCSHKCMGIGFTKRITKICQYCGKEFQWCPCPSSIKRGEGKFCSYICAHMAQKKITGAKVSSWKGNQVKYSGLHAWIRKHKPKPEVCEICKSRAPKEVANISGEYRRDIKDFEWLCLKCHRATNGDIYTGGKINHVKQRIDARAKN